MPSNNRTRTEPPPLPSRQMEDDIHALYRYQVGIPRDIGAGILLAFVVFMVVGIGFFGFCAVCRELFGPVVAMR